MRKSFFAAALLVILAAVALSARPAPAQEAAANSNAVPITTVVTVLGEKYTAPPAIGQADVSVYEGKAKRTVTGWTPAQGDKAGLQLAIVIDDSCRTDLGSQIPDITTFIKSQAKSTSVGVFYASNGTVQAASQFRPDLDAVAKSVRMPVGNVGAYSSIYLSIMKLISGWPVTGARREILIIADGIDRFRGGGYADPDVDSTIERAQKAGVIIHALYAEGVGRSSRNTFNVNIGQGNLSKMADGTGGEAFFQGSFTPISFAPYLEQLNMVLKNQYWLRYETPRSGKGKGELRRLKVITEQRKVEISAPDRVFVPGS